MEQRQLGTSALSVSSIGLGCMGFSQGYGVADDAQSSAVIQGCIEAGVTLIDTAMTYGQGHNERLIGGALAQLGNARDAVRIATKFGIVRTGDGVHLDADPANIADYCDASLQRLGVDVIDLYYLHRVDPKVPISDSIGAMADLVRAGKVLHLGVSEVTAAQLVKATAVHPIAAVQFEWSLAWREPEIELIPTARKLGVGLVPYSPLGRGLLTATLSDDDINVSPFRKSDPRFQGVDLDRNRSQVKALNQLARSRSLTASQISLAWLLAQGSDVVPIPGTRRLDRALENLKAAEVLLTDDDLAALDAAVPPARWSGDRKSFAVPVTSRPSI